MSTLIDYAEQIPGGKPVVVTMMSRGMAKTWIEEHSEPIREMDLWEFLFGIVAEPDEPEPEPEAQPKKPRSPRDRHIPSEPDPYRGMSVRDGRGNRTGVAVRRKLSDDDVREIRWLCSAGRSNIWIAEKYDVSRESISHIRRGLRHRRVVGVSKPSWLRG